MKKYNKSDDKIEEDSTDGEDGHEAPELKNDDSGAR